MQPIPDQLAKLPQRIDALVMDFDGVLTDNRVIVQQDGTESVICHRGDGYGTDLLRKAGIGTAVISTQPNPVVAARCAKLKLECHHGIELKAPLLSDLMAKHNWDPAQVVYIGNDLPDLPCFELVGCAACPSDAEPAVLKKADLLLSKPGGHGAVRQLCDLILRRMGK